MIIGAIAGASATAADVVGGLANEKLVESILFAVKTANGGRDLMHAALTALAVPASAAKPADIREAPLY